MSESSFQESRENKQYSKNSILRYERIFGHTWVSTGGETSTKEFCLKISLKPGDKILDVGSGTGGSAFYLARHYGVSVEGIDLSMNMLSIADERHKNEEKLIQDRIEFRIGDITEVHYPANSFDVIYSRDTILHIKDKEGLFKTMMKWLKPGGYLLISDYCRGDQVHTNEFNEYVKNRGYDLRTVKEYGEILRQAGYKNVQAIDNSKKFVEILQSELKYFIPTKDAFIKDFSQEDYDVIVEGWKIKIERVNCGDQAWGLFIARK